MPQVPLDPRLLVALGLIRRRRGLDPRGRLLQPLHPVDFRRVQQRSLRTWIRGRRRGDHVDLHLRQRPRPQRRVDLRQRAQPFRRSRSSPAPDPTVAPANTRHPRRRVPERPVVRPRPRLRHPPRRQRLARAREPLQLPERRHELLRLPSRRAPRDRASRRSTAATRSTPATQPPRRAPVPEIGLRRGKSRWCGKFQHSTRTYVRVKPSTESPTSENGVVALPTPPSVPNRLRQPPVRHRRRVLLCGQPPRTPLRPVHLRPLRLSRSRRAFLSSIELPLQGEIRPALLVRSSTFTSATFRYAATTASSSFRLSTSSWLEVAAPPIPMPTNSAATTPTIHGHRRGLPREASGLEASTGAGSTGEADSISAVASAPEPTPLGSSTPCTPASETFSVQAVPSKYRSSCLPYGSWFQPAGPFVIVLPCH